MAIRKRQQDHEIDPETDEGDAEEVVLDETAAGAPVAPEVTAVAPEHPALVEARARAANKDKPLVLPDGEKIDEVTIIDQMTDEQRDNWLVMTPEERAAWVRGEERLWVEAVKPGTYPELDDPRFEPYDQRMRYGRFINTETNQTLPGACFRMRRRDIESVLKSPRSTQWVRILAKGEIPKPTRTEKAIPSTTAPRGYGQGRRIGRIIG